MNEKLYWIVDKEGYHMGAFRSRRKALKQARRIQVLRDNPKLVTSYDLHLLSQWELEPSSLKRGKCIVQAAYADIANWEHLRNVCPC